MTIIFLSGKVTNIIFCQYIEKGKFFIFKIHVFMTAEAEDDIRIFFYLL